MIDVYKNCPEFENDSYILRMVSREDKLDLLKVYSDKVAVPFFNSDNCGGDDFYYTTESRMEQAIDYWLFEYHRAGFVRWTIVSKETNEAIGTIELFHRDADDYFTNCGLLRLDIRSDYEKASEIKKILEMIIELAYTLFHCDRIATKAIDKAAERLKALENCGFQHTDETLLGHDGTEYSSYFVRKTERPVLNKNLDSKTFRDFYYLKEELVDFCRKNGLPTSGGKIELTNRIAHFLDTGEILSVSTVKKKVILDTNISEDTTIEADFVCSERHREFFKEHIGTSFSFNVAFQKWLKSNAGKTYKEAIKCWKYKKQLQGHNRYERSDLVAIE